MHFFINLTLPNMQSEQPKADYEVLLTALQSGVHDLPADVFENTIKPLLGDDHIAKAIKVTIEAQKEMIQEYRELLDKSMMETNLQRFHKKRYRHMLPDNICYESCSACGERWHENRGPSKCNQCDNRRG